MQNIGAALKEPAQALAQEAAAVGIHESRKLAQHADELVHLVDEIQLANLLESDTENHPRFVLHSGLNR